MKIQCDVCEEAPATLVCCADEAALCAKCDVQVHAANKLATKHHRLLFHQDPSSANHPQCDICQDKPAFIFCVQDRALLCNDCDAPIHSPNTLSANHHRLLATGIRLALASATATAPARNDPAPNNRASSTHAQQKPSSSYACSWAVHDFLPFSDHIQGDPQNQKQNEQMHLAAGLMNMDMFEDHMLRDAVAAAQQVPQLQIFQPSDLTGPSSTPCNYQKKPRLDQSLLEDDYFTVPDLG